MGGSSLPCPCVQALKSGIRLRKVEVLHDISFCCEALVGDGVSSAQDFEAPACAEGLWWALPLSWDRTSSREGMEKSWHSPILGYSFVDRLIFHLSIVNKACLLLGDDSSLIMFNNSNSMLGCCFPCALPKWVVSALHSSICWHCFAISEKG